MARIQTSGLGGNGAQATGNVDGGSADRVYLASQDLNGGGASSVATQYVSGGNASSTYAIG